MKTKELHGLTVEELNNRLKELSEELFNLRFRHAIGQLENGGYGIVMPDIDELTLKEPEIVKQGSRYGVRLKASAPSLHLMKVDINTEVNPIVGTEQQSEELVKFLLKEFEENVNYIKAELDSYETSILDIEDAIELYNDKTINLYDKQILKKLMVDIIDRFGKE